MHAKPEPNLRQSWPLPRKNTLQAGVNLSFPAALQCSSHYKVRPRRPSSRGYERSEQAIKPLEIETRTLSQDWDHRAWASEGFYCGEGCKVFFSAQAAIARCAVSSGFEWLLAPTLNNVSITQMACCEAAVLLAACTGHGNRKKYYFRMEAKWDKALFAQRKEDCLACD